MFGRDMDQCFHIGQPVLTFQWHDLFPFLQTDTDQEIYRMTIDPYGFFKDMVVCFDLYSISGYDLHALPPFCDLRSVCLLAVDVLCDLLQCPFTYGSSKVRWVPQMPAPELFFKLRML